MRNKKKRIIGELLAGIRCSAEKSVLAMPVSGIAFDSKKVSSGDLFVAVRGTQRDGHDFIREAVSKGAHAVVCERAPRLSRKVPIIRTNNTRYALARIADAFFGRPSDSLHVIGVTGTNGKTTITYIIESILKNAGYKVGVMGTINNRIGNRVFRSTTTTPDPIEAQRNLSTMVELRYDYAVMEISSHSLKQDRVAGIRFDEAIFTNVTEDHLDYHGTMARYASSKRRIFGLLKERGSAVLNADDESVLASKRSINRSVRTYSVERPADIRAKDIVLSVRGSTFTVVTPSGVLRVATALPGRHNVSNICGAIAALVAGGLKVGHIRAGLKRIPVVPGRLEAVDAGQMFKVFVDYAHTEDALRNVLSLLRETTNDEIITVFGCGGDRDRKKRPLMGRVACLLSDRVVITSDNPRSERPGDIIEDIVRGVRGAYSNYETVEDRAKAIRKAFAIASERSVVLLAGKGHEKFQIVGERTVPFDDRDVARSILTEEAVRSGRMSVRSMLKVTGGKLLSGDPAAVLDATEICTDSRRVRKHQFYVALRGKRYDGNVFVKDALRKGACGALVSRVEGARQYSDRTKQVIRVRDTLEAYGSIAGLHRSKFNIPVIGITGSSGKTTTKEMILSILSSDRSVCVTPGTENNRIGVPRALLRLRDSHDAAVLEMGMNRPGEIGRLARIASPTIGVITNIGPAHLGALGGIDGVFREKRELLKYIHKGGAAVLNGDDARLAGIRIAGLKIVTFGFSRKCDYRATKTVFLRERSKITLNGKHHFELSVPGRLVVYDLLAAVAACSCLDIPIESMIGAMENFVMPPKRLSVKRIGPGTIIDDSYNANPSSMRCALDALKVFSPRGRKIFVAGDMAELGNESGALHRQLGDLVARSGVDLFITVGKMSRLAHRTAVRGGMKKKNVIHCKSNRDAAKVLYERSGKGDTILLKGSRSAGMEDAVRCYSEYFIR
ncbi:MAG: UDP-N-acetylmuramoyl-L-alanyl-D-glutamate--2,6-diaminopimelate ligase [Candidatus Omnitrophota bacterium]